MAGRSGDGRWTMDDGRWIVIIYRPSSITHHAPRRKWYNKGTMYTILKSKLRPPAVGWAVLERTVALLRLDAAAADSAVRVLLLTAAAGYSKTTVLAEWTRRLHARGGAVAWYSLSPGDRALPVFLAYLEAALGTALPRFA